MHWGKARLSVCNALEQRARQIIDTNGVMRRPSITGVQALMLYNQLMLESDEKYRPRGQYMESKSRRDAC